MVFNTAPGAATTEQISIGKYMRGGWAAFAKNPTTGLETYGWPQYDVTEDTLVRLAYDNMTGPNLINPYRYDADCILFNISDLRQGEDPSAAPPLPDLGASVTPTGTSNSTTPSPTGTSSTTVPSTTESSTPAATASENSGSVVGVNLLMVAMCVLIAWAL